eukprot:UN26189
MQKIVRGSHRFSFHPTVKETSPAHKISSNLFCDEFSYPIHYLTMMESRNAFYLAIFLDFGTIAMDWNDGSDNSNFSLELKSISFNTTIRDRSDDFQNGVRVG